MARSFMARHKISTVKLVWDETGNSWVKLGIPGQPAWMLISASGKVLGTDVGAIPYEAVSKEL